MSSEASNFLDLFVLARMLLDGECEEYFVKYIIMDAP